MSLNLGSDLSVDNIVRLGSADTKISSQNAVKEVLELTENVNTQTSVINSKFFFKNLLET